MHAITFDSHVPPDSEFGSEEQFLVLDGEPLTGTSVHDRRGVATSTR